MNNNFKSIAFIISLVIIMCSCQKDEIPTVLTGAVIDITGTTSKCGGTVLDEGSASVVARGVCWSKEISPTIDDNKTIDGSGIGDFTSNLTNLDGAKTYYVRAYATNEVGTGYGTVMDFTTLGTEPLVITRSATDVTTTSAVLNADVNPNYLSTAVSFDYGKTSDYGISVTVSQNPVMGNTLQQVNANILGLSAGTTYHFRAKGINSEGTVYGDDLIFVTLGGVPSVIVLDPTNLTSESVTLNGSINANHLETTVTFEYGLTSSYGTSLNSTPETVIGNTETEVSVLISGLASGTDYHYRIKASNILGTTYSNDMQFKTSSPPSLVTKPVLPISKTIAISGGEAINDHGSPNTVRGLCWGTSINPTTSDFKTTEAAGVGSFMSGMTWLLPNTTYFVRAYATNEAGTGYGDNIEFTFTGDSVLIFNPDLTYGIVSDFDNNNYKTITIGTQVWMAENLKTTRYQNGDIIPTTIPATKDLYGETSPKYQWPYNGDENLVPIYGRLYTWYAVADNRKICPVGWHVPSDEEWTVLVNYVINIAKSLAAKAGWYPTSTEGSIGYDQASNNIAGFTALPGSRRSNIGLFQLLGYYGYWWSSTEYLSSNGYMRFMLNEYKKIEKVSGLKEYGLSVRCIKD